MYALRAGLVIVLVWIGALKMAPYEADGIVPFVANSPVMSFLLEHVCIGAARAAHASDAHGAR